MRRMNYHEWLFFIGIFILAFMVRFVGVDVPAVNGDEGDNFFGGWEVIEKGLFAPWGRWGGLLPPVSAWMFAFFLNFFGSSELSLRFSAVIFGVLSVIIIYFLARLHYGIGVAQYASLLTSVVPFLVLYNRDAHPDSVLVFFTLLALLCWEYAFVKNVRALFFFGGCAAGFAFMTKYNAGVISGLYWFFVILWAVVHSRHKLVCVKSFGKNILMSGFGVFVVFVFLLGFDVGNLVYFVHGILFWTVNQNFGGSFMLPWYYFLSVLFDGLSPLLFVFLPIAGIMGMARRTRADMLNVFLCFVFFVSVLAAERKFPRHFLLAVPFGMVLLGNCVEIMKKKFGNKSGFIVLSLFVLTAGGWSVFKIIDYNDYVVWKGVGAFILDTTNTDSSVFVHGGEYWPLKYYTKNSRYITSRMDTSLLKGGDFVIIHRMNVSTPFFMSGPLQNDLAFYSEEYSREFYSDTLVDFYAFVRKYGVRLKTFSYDNLGNKIDVYQIGNIKNNAHSSQEVSVLATDPMTKKVCSIWMGGTSLKRVLLAIIPVDFQNKMTQKCTRGCVDTCGMF